MLCINLLGKMQYFPNVTLDCKMQCFLIINIEKCSYDFSNRKFKMGQNCKKQHFETL